MKWDLLVSRETDLLERYIRFEAYAAMSGYPKRLRVRDLLATRRQDELTHCYISSVEHKRQLSEVLKDYESGVYKKYESIWNIIDKSIVVALQELLSSPSLKTYNNFIRWYKKSRATIFYTEMLNDILQKNNDRSGISRYGKIHDNAEKHSSVIWDKARPFFDRIASSRSVPVSDLFFYLPEEFNSLLRGGVVLSDTLVKIRRNNFVILLKGGKFKIFFDKKARQIDKKEIPPARKKNYLVDKITGQSAWRGCVRGWVRIVNTKEQMNQMLSGEILVSAMTTVRLMPAVKKAAAIVTDEGGLTCHAAIIARELNKPCVVGTKNATEIFKNGDMVEVDANKGIVKKL